MIRESYECQLNIGCTSTNSAYSKILQTEFTLLSIPRKHLNKVRTWIPIPKWARRLAWLGHRSDCCHRRDCIKKTAGVVGSSPSEPIHDTFVYLVPRTT